MVDPIELAQDVRVAFVEVDGDEVRVDIYGGTEQVCGSVVYRFCDPELRRKHLETLGQWATDGTPVTYVRREGEVVLIDEAAVFADACRG
ncbi:MAG: hypothetical protein QOG03_1133 [Actinomycetota bacterium]|jgi:hypothetical protein|nr:hypothetical protein [Actinomycetota bacterium]